MTEMQKMLAGQPYEASDETLVTERMRAKLICHRFNHADPTLLDARMAHLRELLNCQCDSA